ncbi:MAG: winged helix-turn-helix transcriptional regulator [Flavobacteriales bacterium]|nr:winged helix-turn-helix transcriptional regulator [Flavobacteriales bacterium]MBL4736218.1 winged helix-turn-helix transcriptional regulator [Flavobacteriales bacterium]
MQASTKPITKTEEHCIRACPDLTQINGCIQMLEESSESIHKLAQVHSLMGNEIRLKILYIIFKEQKACVCDISDILHMAASPISQHLKKLKDSGLVQNEKSGQTIFYSVASDYMETLLPTFIQITKNKLQTV